jgi:uncharacterized protein DUF5990
VRLGLQKGKDVVNDVPGDADQVVFTVPLRVKKNATTGRPNFLGPYAHGTPEERFIYLSWGERLGNEWDMFRRAKIHLKHLDWKSIEQSQETGRPLEVVLDMTDKRGEPICASVKADRIKWAEVMA